jgi:hypothetical protein
MTPNEKYISFLNRFFIFRKVSSVNTEDLYNSYFLADISEPEPSEPSLLPQPENDLFTDLGREEETSIPNILPEPEKEDVPEQINEIIVEPIEETKEAVNPTPIPKKRATTTRVPKELKVPKEKPVNVPKKPKETKEKVPRKSVTRKVKKNDETEPTI